MSKPPRDPKPPKKPKPNGPTSGEYAVGYKKPPAHSRFKPGNKAGKGRRRSTSARIDAAGKLERALMSTIDVQIEGRIKRLTKFDVLVEQHLNNLIKNPSKNSRYLKDLIELMDVIAHRTPSVVSDRENDAALVRAKLDEIIERHREEEEVRLRADNAMRGTSAGDDHPD